MTKYLAMVGSLFFMACVQNKGAEMNSLTKNDSIFYAINKEGQKTKTIYYPSQKKDSFRLRSYYVDNKLIDSCYISNNGFIKGNLITYNDDGSKTFYQYINIDGSSIVNQFWTIKNQDTLQTNGNYYLIRIFDPIKKQKYFQVQIALAMANDDEFSELFYLRPKGNAQLKSDFSNYRDIEYDTFPSLANGKNTDKLGYNKYWAKRIVAYGEYFDTDGINHIRGILVERKDSLIGVNKNIRQLDRYLFVNKEVFVEDSQP